MKGEMQTICKMFIKADYTTPFANRLISQYNNKINEQKIDDDDYIIQPYLSEDRAVYFTKITFFQTK